MVGINAEALDEAEYRALLSAGLSFVVLWQETYDRDIYIELHPGNTKKTRFEYRLDAYERMLVAGIPHIGMGILSGLTDWREDWSMLILHEAYLHQQYGVSAAILGIPRLKSANGALVKNTRFIPTEEEFSQCVALHNIFSPSTMAFVSTRETWDVCVNLAKGGGCLFTLNCSTIPGGYSLGHRGHQFPTASYDAQVFSTVLQEAGLSPVFNWAFPQRNP
jgi:2-iminoacetate synthase